MSDLEIPEGLYQPYVEQSATYITTFTVDEGKPTEHDYDALVIDLPDLLDAINAEGLPVACPECGALSSLTVPVKEPLNWEVSTAHRNECSAIADRGAEVGGLAEDKEGEADELAGGAVVIVESADAPH